MSNIIGNVIGGADAFHLHSLKKDILYIAHDSQNIEQIADNIKFLNPIGRVTVLITKTLRFQKTR